jgi:hypothetical protein
MGTGGPGLTFVVTFFSLELCPAKGLQQRNNLYCALKFVLFFTLKQRVFTNEVENVYLFCENPVQWDDAVKF